MVSMRVRTALLSLVAMSICFGGMGCATCVEVVATNSRTNRPVTESSVTQAPTLQTPEDYYLSHIALLAHDELAGRGTGSDGIDLAAGYIAGQFAAAGLKPGGPGGTFFQEFDVARPAKLLDSTQLKVGDGAEELALDSDFRPFGFSTKGDFSGEVVFVGYGIVNPDKEYDDYAGVDVEGKIAIMLRREPTSWADGDFTDHAKFDSKIELAAQKGAVGVLIVNQDPGEDGVDGLMRFRPRGEEYGLPAVHVKRSVIDELLAQGQLASLVELQGKLDEDGKNVSAPLSGVRVSGTIDYESKDMLARNVIGVLEGTGAHADEFIVIGGHYDHLGERRGRIYNGADDNASGTAGVIELAYAFAATSQRERSIIFMAFSGEEMGLLGSQYYASDPTVDIGSIKAMINMDMIGRLTPEHEANRLSIQGLGTGDSFKTIVERRAQEAGLKYTPDQSALGPSDHASFYKAGVPSLFFFTGVHDDYHQPGDDVEKINAEGAHRIVDLVYDIAFDILSADEAPLYAEVTSRAIVFRGQNPRAGGVVMGIMPDMEDDSEEPGWRVAAVAPGGGASKAGMKAGDRILKINDLSIGDFMDFRKASRGKSPGDVVEVVVKRGKEELSLSVELSARGG